MNTYEECRDAVRRGDYLNSIHLLRILSTSVSTRDLASVFYDSFAPESIELILDAADDGESLYRLAAEFWDADEWKLAAIEVFRAAIDQGSRQALEAIGDSLDWLGAYEEAIPYLERTRREGIGRPAWTAGLLGHARYQLGDSSAEVAELLRTGASEHTEFGVDYANLLRKRGSYPEAVTLLRELVAANVPGSALVLGNLLDDEFDDPQGAIGAYRRGIEQGDSHSAYNLAILYHHRGRNVLAKKFRAIAREMGDHSAWP